MNYSLIKKILFCLNPETAHHVTLKVLKIAYSLHFIKKIKNNSSPCNLMGLSFPNPIGLAAGLDKNGEYIDALASLGFGFIEIGTITPKPQLGNPLPRLFRLEEHEAIINRMGFNSKGIEYVIKQLQRSRFTGILGINIGKNRDTPLEQAINDYLLGFQKLAPFASYITINISSPNTEGLRDLQHGDFLKNLLHTLKQEQKILKKYVPLVVKISPDLTYNELKNIAEILLTEKIDGVIATNTTISRNDIENSPYKNEIGGLSGKPLKKHSTEIIQQLSTLLQNQIPIIGCGGISSITDAKEKFSAGASLIQIYTGLIYEGPELISNLILNNIR